MGGGLALNDELRNTYVVKKAEPDKTRDQVARTILEGGPASAAALSEKLKITSPEFVVIWTP